MAPSTHPSTASAAMPKRQISQPVHDYVARAIKAEDQYPTVRPAEMQSKLSAVITEKLKNGQEFSTNWATYPLPQEMIIHERNLATRAIPAAGWAPPPPQHLPPPLPPYLPPPPPANMYSALHPNPYLPTAKQTFIEENQTRLGKRRFPEEEEPARRSPSFSHEQSPSRSTTPPWKRQRVQSPTRKKRYCKAFHASADLYRPSYAKSSPTHHRRYQSKADYHDGGNRQRDDYRGGYSEHDGSDQPLYYDYRSARSPTDRRFDNEGSRGRRTQNKSGRARSPRRRSISPRNARNGLKDRITRNGKGSGKASKKKEDNRKYQQDLEDLERRKRRFANDGRKTKQSKSTSPIHDDSAPVRKGRLIGTNTELEKDYFRLTSDPKPELVRPQKVLEKTLDLLKEKWDRDHKYNYMKSQLKSMRQDLTVQHIKNSFTIEVYKTHAGIALEMGDIGEYNQCQTQLRTLHKRLRIRLPTEFIAYQILYYIFIKNTPGQYDILGELNDEERNDVAVKNALDMHSALLLGNYYRFFRLYKNVPNLGRYLVDSFIARERLAALATYAKVSVNPLFNDQKKLDKKLSDGVIQLKHLSTKYPVKLSFFTNDLAFDTVEEGLAFIKEALSKESEQLEFSTDERSESGEELILLNKTAKVLRRIADQAAMTIDIKGQI
jgi:hypothetical protein